MHWTAAAMSQGVPKPPVAPKPKLCHMEALGISSSGLSLSTPRRNKPPLAPKPCVSKLSPAVRSTTLRNSTNVLQENKKPDWDYIIPICLCSLESCTCIRSSSPNSRKKEAHLKAVTVRSEAAAAQENCGRRRFEQKDHRSPQVRDWISTDVQPSVLKAVQPPLSPNEVLRLGPHTLIPELAADAPPEQTCLRERHADLRPPSAPGRGTRDVPTSQVSPGTPVPVPRKPSRAPSTHQGAAEEKEEEGMREVDVVMSSERRSLSSTPAGENMIPSSRNAPAPPAPPPRKKPLLSAPPAPQESPAAVVEAGQAWSGSRCSSSSSSSGMEITAQDGHQDLQRSRNADGQKDHEELPLQPPSVGIPTMHCLLPVITVTAAAVVVKKPQRLGSPQTSVQMEDSCSLRALEGLGEDMKETEKTRKGSSALSVLKVPRPNLSKHKSKSFSASDFTRSDGQRSSFRRLLSLKLSVPKMLPKLMSPSHKDQSPPLDQERNLHENLSRPKRKMSCPLLGVEQSVDRDVFSPGAEDTSYYENVAHYEEIVDYENVNVWPPSAHLQPSVWGSSVYSDEGIYEEQEPYMSLSGTPAGAPSSPGVEEVFENEGTQWDDDAANSSDDADDSNDSSDASSKETPEPVEGNVTQKKTKIHHIATEIMSSEEVFVDVLKLLHVDFRLCVSEASRKCGKPVIEERLLDQILYSLPQLYQLNQDLLRELQHRVTRWDEHPRLADVFLNKGPYLKMYSTYIREFDRNVALLDEQMKRNPAFAAAVRTFEADPRCANLALKHHLLKPVQRIPQYQLLLTDYLKNQSPDSVDYKDTEAALALVKDVANHANDIIKQGDNFHKLIQVQCRLSGRHELVQPGRMFLKEGVLNKLSRKVMQPRMFFLFNDTLLYTTPVQSGQFKLNNILSLSGMKVSRPSQEAYQNELNIESVQRSFILSASSATERDEWLHAISTAIRDYTKKKISFVSGKPLHEYLVCESLDLILRGSPSLWGDELLGGALSSTSDFLDPRATMCMICTCEFSLTWRRHHCRACGKVVCQTCSSNKHCLEYLKDQIARVCDQCFVILQQQKSQRALTSPACRSSYAVSRRQKKIPAALKEVSANTNSSMSGYLMMSKTIKKHGKKLWFVIKDKVLYTYAASEDVAALESQPLLGFELKVDPTQTQSFQLYHKNTLYYRFKAADVPTAQRWVDSFKDAAVL